MNGSNNGTDSEREFHIRNIPEHFNEWDVFNIFAKFALVNNVRIPPNQNMGDYKFGFVSMISLSGSDEVRKALQGGRLFYAENKYLYVKDLRSNPNPSGQSTSASGAGFGTSNYNNARAGAAHHRPRDDKEQHQSGPRVPSGDLPIGVPVEIKVAESPALPDADDLVFHVLVVNNPHAAKYQEMQAAMNNYCLKNKNIAQANQTINNDEYCIYGQNSTAFRGQRISAQSIYLIDFGKVVPMVPTSIWQMKPEFAVLPAMVKVCRLAHVRWTNPTSTMFNNLRAVLTKWGEAEQLIVKNTGFKGIYNLVELTNTQDSNFASSLALKNTCEYTPNIEKHVYNAEIIRNYSMKGDDIMPKPLADESLSDIAIKMKMIHF